MTTIDKSQLPVGAQISGGNARNAVGVIDETLVNDGDVLAQQAREIARSQTGQVYYGGGFFAPEVLGQVHENRSALPSVPGMNQKTIQQVQEGDTNRDQAFVGNNSQWTGYVLEAPAKMVYPLDTPLANMMPRVPGVGSDTVNWRAITDIFGGSGPSVAAFALQQGGTPTGLAYNWVNASNVYKMLSVQDVITFEAEIYAQSFDPAVRAKVAAQLIPALKMGQEMWYINGSQRLWSPPVSTVVPTTATTGGTLAAGTYWFLVTAINANGETLAASSTGASVTTTGSTSTITLTINRVPGAVSYGVYCGINASQPANSAMWKQGAAAQFGSASALNDPVASGVAQGYFTATMTAAPANSGTAYSTIVTAGNTAITVKSTDANTLNLPLVFDGIQSLIYLNAGVGSQVGVGGETPLVRQVAAANGALALSDIDTILERMYLNSRAKPRKMFVSVLDHKKLSNLVAAGTNFRVTQQIGTGMTDLTGGQRVTKYINQTTGDIIDVIMLPYLTQGQIIFASFDLPYPVAEISKPPLRVEYNRDMWVEMYPPDQSHKTQWAYAGFSNETLIIQYLGGMAILNGITLN